MNITFFTLSMECGGAERVIANLCNAYMEKGYLVNLITCFQTKTGYQIDPKVNRISLDDSIDSQKLSLYKRFYDRRNKLKSIISKLDTDIYISFLPEPCLLLTSLRGQIKVPIIISERNDPRREYYRLIFKLAVRLLYRKADGFVFQTNEAREYFSQNIQKNSVIIPNPINEKFIGNERSAIRKKTIVSVGRLEPQKNFPMLLKAFAAIVRDYPDYQLVIYGEGSIRNELQNLADELTIQKKVILFGETHDIINEIKDSSLFILTSDFEGMPNALMEAMALGLPVIATDCPCGGVRYLVEDKVNGRLIPPGAIDELEKNMRELLNNPSYVEQLGKNAVKIVDKVNPTIIYQQWEEYIRGVVEKQV